MKHKSQQPKYQFLKVKQTPYYNSIQRYSIYFDAYVHQIMMGKCLKVFSVVKLVMFL